jgi:outer membrane receptor protein involved in Fe transport
MKSNLDVALLTSAGLLVCGVIQAQTAPTNAPAAATAAAATELEEVSVTGSRVIINGNDSPTPVTVVTVEELQASHPTTVFEGLLDMPAFAGSRGSTASNPSGNQANSNQISALSLRGLGPVRTLVLYDGHRVMPTEQDGLVDANTIPQMLLQRVDIVTGGASAVYGSDAIGGVANFITDRKFTGVKVNLKAGVSDRHDEPTRELGIAFGTDLFGGRGHFEGSIEHHYDGGLLHRNDIEQFRSRWTVQGAGTAALPYFLVAGANNTTYTFGGKILTANPTSPTQPNNPLLNYTFNTNGVLSPFQNGSTAGISSNILQIGGDGIYDTRTSLKQRDELNQVYGRFDFDLTSSLHYFLTASATLDHTFNNYGDVNSSQVWRFSTSNPYLPLAYKQQMEAAGVTIFGLNKKFGLDSLVPPSNVDNYYRSRYINTGLDGRLGEYHWEASYTRSDVTTEAKSNYTFNNGRLFAALDTVINPANGQIVCNVTLTNPGLYPGCVPMNAFGPNSESAAAVDYVQQKQGTFHHESSTDGLEGSLTGAPFNDWAGPVNMALSGEWRRQGFQLTSDKPTVNYAPLDCTGLRFGNCTPVSATNVGTPQFNGGAANRPFVSMTVSEAALEADVPLLKNRAAVKSIDLNLAYRYAKYSANGNPDITAANKNYSFNANTWKIGLDWHIDDRFTLRATRSRDIRAPNLNDLFQPNAITFSNGILDLLTNRTLASSVAVVNGGNPGLRPEVASTTTIGLVFGPVDGLSVAVDYFDIKVKNYISRLNGFDTAFQNACYDSGGASYFCTLQERPGGFSRTAENMAAANVVTKWYVVPVNVAELDTKGVDVEANYQTQLFNRPFSLRGLVTYQPHVIFDQPGSTPQDFAGNISAPGATAAGPKLRVTVMAHYNVTEKLAVDWQTRWRDKLYQSLDPSIVYLPNTNAPSVAYSSVNFAYRLKGPFAGESVLYLNIQNVFNQLAPIAAQGGTASASPGLAGGFVPGDDPLGRYYSVGLRYRR